MRLLWQNWITVQVVAIPAILPRHLRFPVTILCIRWPPLFRSGTYLHISFEPAGFLGP